MTRLLLMLSINFEILKWQEVTSFPECFPNTNIWKIYSEHSTFVNTIKVKILNINDKNQNHIGDTVSTILHNIISFTPIKTIEVKRTKIETNVYLKRKINIPLEFQINRNTRKQNKQQTNQHTRKVLRASSVTEEAYLIVAWNEEVIYQYLHEIPNGVLPKPRALYVILLIFEQTSICTDIFEEIGYMLKMIWEKFNILNIIAQAPCSCNSDHIYIYKPFENHGKTQGIVQINTIEQILTNGNLIINQLRNMRGNPLNISLFERRPTSVPSIPLVLANDPIYKHAKNLTGYYGVDANIVAGISLILNFKIQLNHEQDSYYGKILKNGTITESLGQVFRREVHLSANGRFVTDYGTNGIEFTRVLNSDRICLVVPKSKRKPQWIEIFYCFKLSVWLLIMTVLLIAIIIWNLFQKNHSRKQDISKVCLEMYSICLSIPVNIPTSGARSLFLGTFMLSNVVICGIFQGNLFKSFSKSTYFPDINTLQELADSNLKISTNLHLFQENHSDSEASSEVFRKLREKLECCTDHNSALDKAAYSRSWAAIERQSNAKVLLNTNFSDEQGTPLLHIVDECPYSAFIAYIMPAGSPFLPKFDSIIQMFLESGLIAKWNNDIIEAIIAEKRLHIKNEDNVLRKLTVRDFLAAFFVIIVGYLISLTVFFAEIWLQKKINDMQIDP